MNEELIAYILSGIILAVSFGLLWFRKNSSKFTPILDEADKVIEIVKKLSDIFFDDDDQMKSKTDMYIEIAQKAVGEVREVFDENVDLKKKSVEVTYRIIRLLGEAPTAKQHQIISETINEMLEQLRQEQK